MSKRENDEHIDADILQSKADILRARDVIPPFDKTGGEMGEKRGEIEHAEVPKFDLAHEIMAEHRKSSSVKRQGPGKISEVVRDTVEVEQVSSFGQEEVSRVLSDAIFLEPERDRIISDIVARDIAAICSG